MKIKEFFRLSWAKIILTIFLFIVWLAYFEIYIVTCIDNSLDGSYSNCIINFSGIILNLIISYLLSCLLIFIYSKINPKKNKKGMSAIVGTVLILLLVVVTGSVVWIAVNKIVSSNINQGTSCFNVLDKVSLNNDYTCYNSSSNQMRFSIQRGDIDLDAILVSVSYSGTSKSVTLNSTLQTFSEVKNYPDLSDNVKVPDKNSGLTYLFLDITSLPSSIKIAPIINKNTCEVSDTISNIDDCKYFVE